MPFIDSLPNLHPAVSHFPIALVVVAILFDLVSLVTDRQWLDRAAAALYGLGAVGAVGAYITGQRASEQIDIPPESMSAVSDHADIALVFLAVVVPLAAIRVVLAYRDRDTDSLSLKPVRAVAVVVALVAGGLVLHTANLGGALVFEHGLAVEQRVVEEEKIVEVQPDDQDDVLDHIDPEDRYTVEDNTIRWNPIAADTGALTSFLTFIDGSPDDTIEAVEPEEDPVQSGLVFQIDGTGLLKFPEIYDDVQVDVQLELIDYDGAIGLAHHIHAYETFEMFRFTDDGEGELIRRTDGNDDVLDDGTADEVPDDVFELTVSASGRHFYGRLDGEALAHGHADPLSSGEVGFFFDGAGQIRIHSVTVTPI